jgi:HEAT repeat protein
VTARKVTPLIKIESLIKQLGDFDGKKRKEARNILISLGKTALPAIVSALSEGNTLVRWQAAKALSQMSIPSTAPVLVCVLMNEEDFGIRWLAAEGLIGMRRAGLKPLLRQLIKHPDSVRLREGAHHVLHVLLDGGLLDPPVEKVFNALEGIEAEVGVPWAAEKALEKMSALQGKSGELAS